MVIFLRDDMTITGMFMSTAIHFKVQMEKLKRYHDLYHSARGLDY